MDACRRPVLAAALCAALALLAGPAQAARAVALVLEVAGAADPGIQAFAELAANDSVELGGAGSITLLHYGTCEEVVVQGGTLVVTERQYLTRGGKVAKVTRAKCPKKVALAGEARTGGVRLRAGSAGLNLNPEPSFVLVGEASAEVAEVAILRDGEEIARHKVDGHRFSWPAGAAPLPPGEHYSLVFTRRDGSTGEPIDFDVREGEQGMVLVEAN